jgi:cytochrome c oxidase assembly factor CtaG
MGPGLIVGTSGPYAWDPHPVTWALLLGAVALVGLGHRRLLRADDPPILWPRRQIALFAGACAAAVVALTWPLADLAAHWSLTTLVAQRLILLMAVAPMLLLGLPYDLVRWLTRPAAVDAVLVRLQRAPVAIITVTVLVVGSMTPVMVRAQSSSPLARGALDLVIVVAGLVLWIPVIGRIPGIPRLKPVMRFGYLVFQAVVPAFLSFIYIFSRHPLYGVFAGSHQAIGLRPLNDQQIAGFLSKLTMLFTLLTVGAVVLARASRDEDELGENDPLVWADVERQFERADRQGPPATGEETGAASMLRPPPDRAPGPGSDPGESVTGDGGPRPDRSEQSQGGPDAPDRDQPDP